MQQPTSANISHAQPRLSILCVMPKGGTSLQRRNAFEELGHETTLIEDGAPTGWRFQIHRAGFKLHRPPDLRGVNRSILEALKEQHWDILWVEKSLVVRPETLAAFRRESPGTALISYSPDDCRILRWESVTFGRAIPEYDLHITTKSYNVDELRDWGARDVFFVNNAYCPGIHRPIELAPEDRNRWSCEAGFVGYFEEDRAEKMLALARAGIPVVVRGKAWGRYANRHPKLDVYDEYLGDEDYPKAVSGTAINLGFLRKRARDLQTTRSIEIPACGSFLLAERTEEHMALFEEGVEAEFFDGFEELLEKCRYYLTHPKERQQIAAAGLDRCRRDGYANADRLSRILEHVASNHSQKP